MPIPRFGLVFQEKIVAVFRQAQHAREKSIQLLKNAETILLCTLGLENWQAPESLSYIRNSCDVFAAGRLDAQFFAPRVECLLNILGSDGFRLADVALARHEKFTPTATDTFQYIEIGGVGPDGTASSEQLAQSEAPSRATQYVRAGDVITSTVRPIRCLSALITPEQDGCVCSSGFVVLQPREISSEVLLTYLRLPLVCELMDLYTSATMYPAISESDLLGLPIRVISDDSQQSINVAVRAATESRKSAALMLDAVKRVIEIAIDESEATAMAYLEGLHERGLL